MKSNSRRLSFAERTLIPFFVAVAGMLAVSCVSVNRLREAQDSFNQSAAAENAARLDGNPSETTASLASVRSGFASALFSLSKLEPKDEQRLRQDGLWDTALTLKALCQWRLAQYQLALSSVEEAQKTAGDQVFPRDRALLAALPGLIKTDQAYNKVLMTNSPLPEVEALLIGPAGAIPNIQSARELADKDHPIQLYLIQAQLAAYRNFMIAQDRLNNHATVPVDAPARTNANAQLKELDLLIKKQKPGSAGQDLVNYWARLCALDVP